MGAFEAVDWLGMAERGGWEASVEVTVARGSAEAEAGTAAAQEAKAATDEVELVVVAAVATGLEMRVPAAEVAWAPVMEVVAAPAAVYEGSVAAATE